MTDSEALHPGNPTNDERALEAPLGKGCLSGPGNGNR